MIHIRPIMIQELVTILALLGGNHWIWQLLYILLPLIKCIHGHTAARLQLHIINFYVISVIGHVIHLVLVPAIVGRHLMTCVVNRVRVLILVVVTLLWRVKPLLACGQGQG